MEGATDNLYKPPEHVAAPRSPAAEVTLNGYTSLLRRAKVVVALLAIWGAVSLTMTGVELYVLSLVPDVMAGLLSPREVDELVSLEETVGLVSLLMLLVTALVFLRWVRTVHENLVGLERESDVTPSAAVTAYFIPFLNFVRPYRHMLQAWRLSAPKRSEREAPSPIAIWWGAWIASGVLGYMTRLAGTSADAPHSLLVGVQGALAIAAAFFCAQVVLKLSERQERAAARTKRRWRKRRRRKARKRKRRLFADEREAV